MRNLLTYFTDLHLGWKASGHQFLLFLNDRWEIALQLDVSSMLVDFGAIFRPRTLQFRFREGLAKQYDFSLIFEPYLFRLFSILGPQGGPQEGAKCWLPCAFYDILASQSPSRGPATIFNNFLTFFDRFFIVFSHVCWLSFDSFLVDVISILKWMLGSFWQVV